MGMLARSLHVCDWRSFEEFELELDPAVTVLVGRNAVGKTNLVEALQFLTAGQSFRRPATAELVREGARGASADLLLEGEGRRVETGLRCEEGRRSFVRNGKKTTAAGVRGVVPSVLFCPDHLDMVKRSARVRRQALDDFGVQLSDRYANLAAAYARTVEQRNNLLKDLSCSPLLLETWDDALVNAGCALLAHRSALLARIRDRLKEVYTQVAPQERADVGYMASIGLDEERLSDREATAAAFRAALHDAAEDERRRGITLVGPHRDEISFTIDGRAARAFASQGQQRSLVLAWKIAEVEVTADILGRHPLLLLDDVMSELDARRRAAIMGFIQGEIQTVITTTNLGYFSPHSIDSAKVVHIGEEA